ncbi:P-loop containing nucleoside triphosphate hydrolase protein [Nemania sp. FL0031]|nr:P-loop containing nucleoside triphosphate hydrolase protein [Nemania sp. FL0031]
MAGYYETTNGLGAISATIRMAKGPRLMRVDDGEVSPPEAVIDDDGIESEEDVGVKVAVGMICKKKDLYQKIDQLGKLAWTAKMPSHLEEAAENKKSKKYAILIRNKKSYDSHKKLEIDSIIIQSPLLKNILHDVLKEYPGVTTTLSRLIFSAPFRPFVHRRGQLDAAYSGEQDEDTKNHLALLKDVLHNELSDIIATAEDYVKHKVVSYEEIWTIFEPGCVVYANQSGKSAATRLVDGQFIKHPDIGPCFQVKCDRVDWDGSQFGYAETLFHIKPFDGTVPITDLDCFPLSYHPDEESVKEKLIARGRQFEKLAGYHYKSYKGRAIQTTRYGPQMITVDGRVIIDGNAHRQANAHLRLYLKPIDRIRAAINVEDEDSDDEELFGFGPGFQSRGLEDYDTTAKRRRPLKEEQLLICAPVVRGYSLRAKLWLEFFVDSVSEIVFSDKAFDSLVIPEGHKSLILAIAQAQVQKKDVFDDVISGKGRGIIMLLSGGPGIGKTLTAESVAEHMRVPLYMMSAADLGTNTFEVEIGLTRVLGMVARWNAILLLDECEVFLEARSTHDLQRNRIVSIFLRTLEYYEGLLFLTTNRIENMDEAFNSRIHFQLSYPNLDAKARRTVWQGFLDRQQGGYDVDDEQLVRLERLEINGRVIKNILKSATLLASHKNEKLGFQHIETVLQVNGHEI